jgi:large subunit ribosomal protein L25
MFNIQAKKRDLKVKLEKDQIPAVFYGAKAPSTPIEISVNEFKKVWREAGETSTVKLSVDGKDVDVLINDVQLDPIKNTPTHVDFLVVDMNKKISVAVPVEFVGVSPAVKGGLGVLVKVLYEVEVEALPKDLPQKLEVDIAPLVDLDSSLKASDIKLPSGVSLITKETEILAAVAPHKEEKESEPVDLSKIEVEKKGKKEEETVE